VLITVGLPGDARFAAQQQVQRPDIANAAIAAILIAVSNSLPARQKPEYNVKEFVRWLS
jgi:hypothetical protein